MNVTITLDAALVERARALAAARGKSLSQVVREMLEAETANQDPEHCIQLLDRLWATTPGDSGGLRFRRDHAYGGPR
jgi:hypothetical protein